MKKIKICYVRSRKGSISYTEISDITFCMSITKVQQKRNLPIPILIFLDRKKNKLITFIYLEIKGKKS